MKTNKLMHRKIGNFKVIQRTQDGYFNATYLLQQWNQAEKSNKEVKEFLRNKQTQRFLKTLEHEEFQNRDDYPYLQKRGKAGGTWMHPYLFIKFAMWLNPKFEYYVIRFVYDQLIQFRHQAGDNYKRMTRSLINLDRQEYWKVAEAINFIVLDEHDKELRQRATPEQLREMARIEDMIADNIEAGLITNHDQLMSFLRQLYLKKRTMIA